MGRSRNIRALTANVEKHLSDAVGRHCERLGKPVSQWLGSAAELNLAIDAGKMALFDISAMELERRKQWAEDWAKIGSPGDLNDECRKLLHERVLHSEGYMVIPSVEFNQMLLGFYNTQEQWRHNSNFWESRSHELEKRLAEATGLIRRTSDLIRQGWKSCERELQAVRRRLARHEEPENCQ